MHTDTDALPCIGVVLAGGASRRMGRDKALLAWRRQPLIEHQLATLRAAGVDEVMVSGDRPAYRGIADARPNAGPVAGLASVAALRADDMQLLVIPVDMPLLQSALLQRLRTEHTDASCVRFVDTVLPLRLRVDAHGRRVLDALTRSDEPRERSLRSLQRHLDGVEIPLTAEEAAQLTDCNTEATWNKVRQ